ncbi:MAG: hypothetical protein COT43_00325, partial [Candidatus Marinimicrobia bacterium CG08_land_8_20_14_0_20_45_22]
MWVLLGGNNKVIPIRYGASTYDNPDLNSYLILREEVPYYIIPTDLYYADFNGDWKVDDDYYGSYVRPDNAFANLEGKPRYGEPNNDDPDYYPEIFIGRLLVSSAEEIDTWTKKYLNYVLYPNDGNFTYLGNALHTQADHMQWYYNPSQAEQIDAITESFWSTTIIEEDIEWGEATYPQAANVINYMNTNDYGLILFSNHGGVAEITVASDSMNVNEPMASLISYWPDFGWDAGLEDNLDIKNTPYIVYSNACDIAGYDYNFSWSSILKHGFVEAFIVEENLNAVAFAGNTRFGWVGSSFDLEKTFFNDVVDDDDLNGYPCRKMGVGVAASKVENSSSYLDYSNNYFGDPEMNMWVGTPSQLLSASVTVNSSNIVINAGISGCDICVSSGDNGSSYYLAVSGVQSYTFSTTVRPLYITITKPNYLPYTAVTGGTFTTAETWFGNLHMLGTVLVTGSGSITILPGTNVLMDGYYTLGFYNNAHLIAEGTNQSPILFTSTSGTTRQSWNRLYFRSSNNVMKYCEVEYGDWAVCYYGYPSTGNIVENCTLHDNDQGIRIEYTGFDIKNCEIYDNRHNIVTINNPQVDIEGTRIYNGDRDGIYSVSSNTVNIYGSVIENNGIGGTSTRNGIYAGYNDVYNIGYTYSWSGYNTIRNNYSSEIYAGDISNVQIFQNSVHDNDGYEVYNSLSGNPTILAWFDWWGETPANSTQFYGNVNYNDELESQPSWEGQTSSGQLSKPVAVPADYLSPEEQIVHLKNLIATNSKTTQADSALVALFSIVRSDYIDNRYQERDDFYSYLSKMYDSYENYPLGKRALQYMIVWKMLANENETAIKLSLKALDCITNPDRMGVMGNLVNLYTYSNQYDLSADI